eukprot:TRINITY_DN9833_c0_g5_i1.p1 TRINITY_DN9833_c0_g5~~TRINITY_DN9833_c0_g5_i1.p1  ORF type:complete len:715 (-),score=196.95 TRINITY_DN9833_c0_g5_i1:46-2190(-)
MTTITVSKLSPATTFDSLVAYFGVYGDIEAAEIKVLPVKNAASAKVQKQRIGIVVFKQRKSADGALADAAAHYLDDAIIDVALVKDGNETEEAAPPRKKKAGAAPAEEAAPKRAKTASGSKEKADDKTKVLVSKLAPETDAKSIKKYFQHYGTVLKAELKVDEVGESRCCALVTFARVEEARAAVQEKEAHVIDETCVVVRWFDQENSYAKMIFISGVSPHTEDASIVAHFQQRFGKVKKIQRVSGSDFAMLQFATEASAKLALLQEEHVLDGQTLKVNASNKEFSAGNDKLFIGSLIRTANKAMLKEHFAPYGEIVETKVMRDEVTHQCRGWAMIRFRDASSVDLVLNDPAEHRIGGKAVEVRTFRKHPPTRLYVGDLDRKTTAEALKEYMTHYGKVDTVDLKKDILTDKSRGFAFVTFVDDISAELAIGETEDHILDGAKITVRPSSAPGLRISVSNLSKKTTAEALAQYLGYYGELSEVDIKVDAEGKSMRFASVEYCDPISAELAVTEEEHVLDGYKLEVAYPGRKEFKLSVKSKWPISVDSLWSYFAFFGELSDVQGGRTEGVLTFADGHGARAALDYPEHQVDGQSVEVFVFSPHQRGKRSYFNLNKIFVGGLSKGTTSEKLWEYLSYYGKVVHCEVVVDKATGESRGFAFARFSKPGSVELCLSEEQHELKGQVLTVKEAEDRKGKGKGKGKGKRQASAEEAWVEEW